MIGDHCRHHPAHEAAEVARKLACAVRELVADETCLDPTVLADAAGVADGLARTLSRYSQTASVALDAERAVEDARYAAARAESFADRLDAGTGETGLAKEAPRVAREARRAADMAVLHAVRAVRAVSGQSDIDTTPLHPARLDQLVSLADATLVGPWDMRFLSGTLSALGAAPATTIRVAVASLTPEQAEKFAEAAREALNVAVEEKASA